MAEQEVIKHTKKVYKTVTNVELSLWQKFKELMVEIFIIFFAVTVSIWFHNWSEHRHEQKQVKTFLLGLKKDITADINDCEALLENYKNYDTIYRYFNSLDKNKVPNADSLKKMLPLVRGNAFLRARQSRFNGFISAGKIMTIENDSLGLNILNYYQEAIPILKSSENAWVNQNATLQNYLVDNVKSVSDKAQWEVLITPKAKYLTKGLIPWPQLLDRYRAVITSGEKVVKMIDKEYPEAQH